jgi:hypothetical protein
VTDSANPASNANPQSTPSATPDASQAKAEAPAGSTPAPGQASPDPRPDAGLDGLPPSFWPDERPAHFKGKDAQETLENLWKAYEGARTKLATGKVQVPDVPEEYVFEPSETAKTYLTQEGDDRIIAMAKKAAHAAGMNKDAFGAFLNTFTETMVSEGLLEDALDVEKERSALVPPDMAHLPKHERDAYADKRVRENHALIDSWKQKGLPEQSAVALSSMLDWADMNLMVEWVRDQLTPAQPSNGGQSSGVLTKADLEARVKDPRAQIGHPDYDPNFEKETIRLYNQFYGSA